MTKDDMLNVIGLKLVENTGGQLTEKEQELFELVKLALELEE